MLKPTEFSVAEALLRAQDQSSSRKLAENDLKSWESSPNFYSSLQKVYFNQTNSPSVRWLAIIQLKNGVSRNWRGDKISKEEKKEIMEHVFDGVDEEDDKLIAQNALIIGKIVRYEYNNLWKSAIADIRTVLEQSTTSIVALFNVLSVLNQVLKVLNSVKIGITRKRLEEELPEIQRQVVEIYFSFFDSFKSSSNLESAKISYMAFKVCRKIQVSSVQVESDFHKRALENFKVSLMAENGPHAKFARCYCKMMYELMKRSVPEFVLMDCSSQILEAFFEILSGKADTMYSSSAASSFPWEFILVKIFLCIKEVLTANKKGETMVIKKSMTAQQAETAKQKLASFFPIIVLQDLASLIMEKYLLLTPAELENWNEDPEQFVIEESQQSWEDQLRPCCEAVFQTLVSYESIAPFVADKILQLGTQQVEEGNVYSSLVPEALLTVTQLSCSLNNYIDFDEVFPQLVIPQCKTSLLKHRVCLAIEAWISIKCSRENRSKIYQLLMSFLADQDVVLQLTAVKTLQTAIQDWDFNRSDFAPYSDALIKQLMNMITTYELIESKLTTLNCLNAALERNGDLISKQSSTDLLSVFPEVWAYFNDDGLMAKTVLIRILANLIKCFNDSQVAWKLCSDIISSCCDARSDFFAVLSEDGFDLWQVVLDYFPLESADTPNYKDPSSGQVLRQMIEKLPLLQESIISSTEILPLLLSIFKSYIGLIPISFFPDVVSVFLKIFKSLAPTIAFMRDDALDMFSTIVDLLWVRLADFNLPLFLEIMTQSEVFQQLVMIIIHEDIAESTANKLLLIASRFFYNNPVATELAQSIEKTTFKQFVDCWFLKSSNFYEARKRKQNLLGLSGLLVLGNELQEIVFVRENINLLFSMWTVFFDELNENKSGDCQAYYKQFNYYEFDVMMTNNAEFETPDPEFTVFETWEFKRYKNAILAHDPIHTKSMRSYVGELLEGLKNKFGTKAYESVLGLVDDGFIADLQTKIGS